MRYECESFARSGDGWEAHVRVPASSPYFHGHFEGAPVLPGVALLVIAREILARRVPGLPELLGLSALRFRSKVAPGQRLTLTWTQKGGRELELVAHVDETIAAECRLLLAGALP
jgi:3-hydroxymyristoyl/3-hydroxydecanoyl-(acyl carrier protein) dehydratase